jgi:hypothetical protein
MSERAYLLSIPIVMVMIALGCFYFYREMRQSSREARTWSTILNLSAAVDSEIEKGSLSSLLEKASSERGWYRLNDAEYDNLILDLKSYDLDPPSSWDKKGPLLDFWGNRFVVMIKVIDGGRDVKIMSKGRDGLLGTDDDIEK